MKKLWLLLALPVIALDQLVKHWAVGALAPEPWYSSYAKVLPRSPIPGIGFRYAENTGAAFSFLAGTGSRWFLVAVSALAAAAIVFIVCKNWVESHFGLISVSCVLGGAVGNLIDRILRGYVVDMLEFTFINFAVFNVADIFITVGGACFCLYMLLEVKRGKENAPVDEDG